MKSIEELCNEEISALRDVERYEESFNNRTDAFSILFEKGASRQSFFA